MSQHRPVRSFEDTPERALLAAVTEQMIAAWEKAEGKKVNVSYVATFVDMARAVIDGGHLVPAKPLT